MIELTLSAQPPTTNCVPRCWYAILELVTLPRTRTCEVEPEDDDPEVDEVVMTRVGVVNESKLIQIPSTQTKSALGLVELRQDGGEEGVDVGALGGGADVSQFGYSSGQR